jgi:hypothetical protein
MSNPEVVGCHLCGKPALGAISGLNGAQLPICAEHYIGLQSVENERHRNLSDQLRYNMAMMNLASDEMNAITGIAVGGRVVIPEPTPASSHTAISVTGSTVGVINTAAVGQITANLGTMAQNVPAKAAMSEITAAVLSDPSLSDTAKKGLLDQLAVVAVEAAEVPEKRKAAVVSPMLAAIGQGAGTVTALATAWKAVEPILRAHFGLP